MELLPILEIGLRNGWLLLAILYLEMAVVMAALPKSVVKRLIDRSGWNREKVPYVVVGKLFSLASIVLLIFTPLKIGAPVFYAGLILLVLGLMGLVVALINYKNAPPDRPATNGFYRLSRNPQIVSLAASFFGMSLAVGSWLIVLTLFVSYAFQYFFLIREEERACLAQYGEAYRDYMAQVPRFLLFF
jgi:protein-S-isoprenylcysteine O-methyltransferase Ste14